MPERLRIADCVAQLPESDWQNLVRGRPALRLEVLEAITSAATRPLSLQIFLLEDEAPGLAAAAICEPVIAPEAHSPLDALLFGRATRLARVLRVPTRPTLLFKTPLGSASAVALRPGSPAERRRLLHRLLNGIEEHAAQCKLGVAFIGIPADDELLTGTLRERGYLETEINSTTRLEIEWSDFDGYIEHLRRRSKHAAQNARTERSRNRSSGVCIRQVQNQVVDAHAMYRLFREHYRHKNGREPLEGPQFLPQLREALGEDLLVFEAVRGGQLVAMLGVVRSGSVGWLSWLGFDLRNRRNDFTWANLCFYHLADSAAALGLKTLLHGNSALDAKRRRGCRVIASRLFYRPAQRFVRVAARPYFSLHRAWYRWKLR